MGVYDNLVGMEEVLDEFIIETTELLEAVNQDLVTLEGEPEEETVNTIFRAFHTIKGTCGFLGFEQAKALAHIAEDLLNKLRNGQMTPNPTIIDVLLESSDWFIEFVEDVKKRDEKEYEIDGLLKRLEAARAGEEVDPVAESADGKPGKPENSADGQAEPVVEAAAGEEGAKDAIAETAPAPEAAAEAPAGKAPAPAPHGEIKSSKGAQTIRVDVERLENLMNLAGELVLGKNQLGQVYGLLGQEDTADSGVDGLDSVNNLLGRITTEIQEAVMQMRMLPISQVFRKFPRVVRDLSRERGREVLLKVVGEETELDRSVIEAISDPLLHLVRNAVDHGIESPETREANNKPREGVVTLEAAHKGNHIIIVVSDDGAGIDADVLANKAAEKGVISSVEADTMSYQDKLNLIFKPGFSTAKKVTDVSGRGVGMDVVHTNVSKLNGAIDVATKLGQGTSFTIKLPLTLAIVTGLKVSVWDEDYIIPFNSIIETMQLAESDLTKIEDNSVIRFRDSVVHTHFLEEWFKAKPPANRSDYGSYAVVVAVGGFRYALVVTGLKGQEEAVIKPLGQVLGKIPGIAGGTIGGDGRITLIIDVPELVHHMGLG